MNTKIEINYEIKNNGMLYPKFNYDVNNKIGKYGMMALKHLKENFMQRYVLLLMEDKLLEYANTVNENAHTKIDTIVNILLKQNSLPNPTNAYESYRHKNMLHLIAEEIVLDEILTL